MKFSFNQLKKFWQEKDQVTWQQVKSYLEKHLEVEVEEEVPIDIPDSWWLKEVAPANEKTPERRCIWKTALSFQCTYPRKFLIVTVAVPAFVC